jgi:hypothetical protein
MISLNETLPVAPCGINCFVCVAHLREKNKCAGCRGTNVNKPITRVKCKLKTCKTLIENKLTFCFECKKFPCGNLKSLDKRYRTKYNMSVIENLENIKKVGIEKFLRNEKTKWTCIECGGTVCVHNGYCYSCGKKL